MKLLSFTLYDKLTTFSVLFNILSPTPSSQNEYAMVCNRQIYRSSTKIIFSFYLLSA